MADITKLEPRDVFGYFHDLCQIPHGSGNTRAISEYCMNFAKKHGLYAERDDLNNVLIRKPASKGYETKPGIVLQGHLDMVCEKTADTEKDFLTEGIDTDTDGEYVFAHGTTLGGDDGIAVAMALAALVDDTLPHPELEAIFTTDEETGMNGAKAFDISRLHGNRIINIDSENEGVITAGCAGGLRMKCTFPLEYAECTGETVTVQVAGLLGGHSGVDINRGRANALKILARLLAAIGGNIADISGGTKDNVIPASAQATVTVPSADDAATKIAELSAQISAEYSVTDPDIRITCEKTKDAAQTMDAVTSEKIIAFLTIVPNGVQRMEQAAPDQVETSLNLASAHIIDGKLEVMFSLRSSRGSSKTELARTVRAAVKALGGECTDGSEYPAWEYNPNSKLLQTCREVYKKMYKKDMKVEIIHAGLECGLFTAKREGIECVSIGPDMFDIHTPKERLNIASVGRVYEYVKAIISE